MGSHELEKQLKAFTDRPASKPVSRICYADGSLKYEGEIQDGVFCGLGRLYREDGSLIYEGEWKDGKYCGQGKEYSPDGILIYDGTYRDGIRDGRGYCVENSDWYEGEFRDGKFCGQGCFYAETGNRYEGSFKDGKYCGRGRYYRANGSLLYEGEWKDGKYCGHGRLYREDETLAYEGEFKDDTPADPYPMDGAGDLDACLEELDSLIGLDEVKRQVKALISTVRTQSELKRRGLVVPDMSYHMIFTGNPGTGKATVARLIGRIYANLGAVSSGHMIWTDRAQLVAGHVGQTALRTEEVVDDAMGGILFIYDADSLVKGDSDCGQEAIDCLLRRMEDDRDNLVVIAAGEEGPMEEVFLGANEGLRARFRKIIRFDDYTLPDLLKILEFNCKKAGYHLGPGVQELFAWLLEERMQDEKFMETFSNGHYVRDVFEAMKSAQWERLGWGIADLNTVPDHTLTELTVQDLQHIVNTGKFYRLT